MTPEEIAVRDEVRIKRLCPPRGAAPGPATAALAAELCGDVRWWLDKAESAAPR